MDPILAQALKFGTFAGGPDWQFQHAAGRAMASQARLLLKRFVPRILAAADLFQQFPLQFLRIDLRLPLFVQRQAGNLEQLSLQQVLHFRFAPGQPVLRTNCRCDVLDGALQKGPWLLGDNFSAADIVIGSGLNFGVRLFKMIPSRPSFEAYIARCMARPAFQRAEKIAAG